MGNSQTSKNKTKPESSERVVKASQSRKTTQATRTPTQQPQVVGNIQQNGRVPQTARIDLGICALCENCHVDTKSQTCGQAQESKQNRPDVPTHSRKSETVQKASSSSQTSQSINQSNNFERSQAKTQAAQRKLTQVSKNLQIRQGEAQKNELINSDKPTPARQKETITESSQTSQTAQSIRRSNDKELSDRNSAVTLENQQKNDSWSSQTGLGNNDEENACAPEIPPTKCRPTRDDPWYCQTGQSRDFELCVFCEQNNASILKIKQITTQDEPCHSQTGQSSYLRLCVICEEIRANFLKQRAPSHSETLVPKLRPTRNDPLNSQTEQSRPQILETQCRSTQDLQKSHLTRSQTNIHEIRRIPTRDDLTSRSLIGQSHDVQLCKRLPKSRDTQRSLTRDDWRHSQNGQSQVEQFENNHPEISEAGRRSTRAVTSLTDQKYSQIPTDHNVKGIGQYDLGHPEKTAEYLEKLYSNKLDIPRTENFTQYPQTFYRNPLPNTTNCARFSDEKKSTTWCSKCQTAYRTSYNDENVLCQHLRNNYTFKEVQCPFGCASKSTLKKLLNHLDNLHDQDTANVGSEMQLQDIDNNSQDIHLVLIGGYHFLFHVKVSQERKVYMTVQFVGSKKNAARWFYEIQVYNKTNFRRKYTFTDTCRSIYESVDDIFAVGNCSVLSKTYASSFTQNGGLSYKFFIRKLNRKKIFHNNQRVKAGSDQREAQNKHQHETDVDYLNDSDY